MQIDNPTDREKLKDAHPVLHKKGADAQSRDTESKRKIREESDTWKKKGGGSEQHSAKNNN